MNALQNLPVGIVCLILALTSPISAGAAEYVAHEWGTFTTLSDPAGDLLEGLEVEEEVLPPFVYSLTRRGPVTELHEEFPYPHFGPSNTHPGFGLTSKGLRIKVSNVTVKMEIPVIYFYSENSEPFPVKVRVGFTGGSISQWYPARTAGETIPFDARSKGIDFAGGNYRGSIEWDIDVLPPSRFAHLEVIKVNDTPSWIHPRLPASNVVANRSLPLEKEKYLFYRGLGNFSLPATFRQMDDDRVSIQSKLPLGFALVFQRHGTGARFQMVKNLPSGETSTAFTEDDPYRPLREIQVDLLSTFQSELVAAGLNHEEAESMLLTWWKSYFSTPGTRIFWLVPRAEVDRILPITLDPAPQGLERVIVGRAELISPKTEQRLMTEFSKEEQDANHYRSSRYFRAYQGRYGPGTPVTTASVK